MDNLPLLYSLYLKREGVQRVLYRSLLKDLKLKSLASLRILDIGCGDGHVLRRLMEFGARPENLFGVDVSPTIVGEAKRLSAPRMTFQEAMGNQLPFADQSFDLLLCFGVIIHIMEDGTIRSTSEEFRRVTRPNGNLFLMATNDVVRYDSPSMTNRARIFDRTKKEVETLFQNWDCLSRDDTLFESIESMLELVAILSESPGEAETIRGRSSSEAFLLEGTVDYDLSRLLRLHKFGSLSCYRMKPLNSENVP